MSEDLALPGRTTLGLVVSVVIRHIICRESRLLFTDCACDHDDHEGSWKDGRAFGVRSLKRRAFIALFDLRI